MHTETAIRILIAEDDAFTRIMVKRAFRGREFDIAESANGEEALQRLRTEPFDVILVDWMMPKMDGIELIKQIRQSIIPQPYIIMVTAITSDEGKRKAMESGADAFLPKPFEAEEIQAALRTGYQMVRQGRQADQILSRRSLFQKKKFFGVGIASSTGGPQTLLKLFTDLPKTDRAAFLMVQHGPAWMLSSFTDRLQSVTAMKVLPGTDGAAIQPGHIYLAPGDRHMIVDPTAQVLRLIDDPPENYCKPAADPLFRSIAASFGSSSVGVVLSGMGKDGTIGSGYIAAAGGTVVAQDPTTAILPSMPTSVIDLRIASHVFPLNTFGRELGALLHGAPAERFRSSVVVA